MLPTQLEGFHIWQYSEQFAGQLPLQQACRDGLQACGSGSWNVETFLLGVQDYLGRVPRNKADTVFRLCSWHAAQPRAMERRTKQQDQGRKARVFRMSGKMLLGFQWKSVCNDDSKNNTFNTQLNKNESENVQYLIPLLLHNLHEQVSMELSARYHLKESC